MTTRRALLASFVAASAVPRLGWADAGNPAYIAAAREPDGTFALFGLSETGADVFRIPLPDRGHAATAHPSAPEIVAFARRPGTFALVIDGVGGRVIRQLDAPPGRHFYGHGAFLGGGDILCTTENEIDTGEGRIGLWLRREGYRRIGEVASGGIGPHDMKLLADGRTLVVANGGIRTHPDRGREKLNLDTMRPNLTYLDATDGILEQVELAPDLHQCSIRHLALGQGGQVAFAMQCQGDPNEAQPLLGLHRRGEAPVLCEADLGEQVAMQGYAGSIAFDGAAERVAITSPRGGRVHVFDREGSFRAVHLRADVCGIGAAVGGFVATDGLGGVLSLTAHGATPLARAARAWDNHLILV
ncbi:DUF1513 domain-containing protein [Oceaniglobus trochenteri]|uniref:DUF1513 domain-containing protein n=1 Tax=Oceaniglobus trochenteri TaxID=2763260 RepID=UPI001CFF5885|nr:DUF1513 domain-containing protein [Oceaniglobus trochenteri]